MADLDTPRLSGKKTYFRIDDDTVGAYAEKVARFFGTGRYLMWQTVFVTVWVVLNLGATWWKWDPYPFILLNLAFSTQAAYAAPLILLAQNRQEDRDRISLNEDRRRAFETKSNTEFITRELTGLRLAVGEVVTRDYLRHELDDLRTMMERIEAKIADEAAARTAAPERRCRSRLLPPLAHPGARPSRRTREYPAVAAGQHSPVAGGHRALRHPPVTQLCPHRPHHPGLEPADSYDGVNWFRWTTISRKETHVGGDADRQWSLRAPGNAVHHPAAHCQAPWRRHDPGSRRHDPGSHRRDASS